MIKKGHFVVILLPQTLEFSILNFLPSPPCEGVIHGQILDVVMVWQEQWGVTIFEDSTLLVYRASK